MKYIKTYEEFVNESLINEAAINSKDWDRMLKLVMKNDDGEKAAKLITKKDKAVARFIAGLKLGNRPLPEYHDSTSSYWGVFSDLGNKAIELGATAKEIEGIYNNTAVPLKYTEKMTKLAGKKLQDRFAGPISQTILDLGFDIKYLPHNGYAITSPGQEAMQRNGRKWTIGYKAEIKKGKEKLNFTFDAITDEGGGATFYTVGPGSANIFNILNVWKPLGKNKFIAGLKDILKK